MMQRMSRAQKFLLIYMLLELEKPRIIRRVTRSYGAGGIGKHGNDWHTSSFYSSETDIPVLTDAKYPNALLLDGSRAMTGALNLDDKGIKLGAGTSLWEYLDDWVVVGYADHINEYAWRKNLALNQVNASTVAMSYMLALTDFFRIDTRANVGSYVSLRSWDGAYIDTFFTRRGNAVFIPRTLPANPEEGSTATDSADGRLKHYRDGAWRTLAEV